MGFGRTPNVESFSGSPPLFGSFPLDHQGTWFTNNSSLATFIYITVY